VICSSLEIVNVISMRNSINGWNILGEVKKIDRSLFGLAIDQGSDQDAIFLTSWYDNRQIEATPGQALLGHSGNPRSQVFLFDSQTTFQPLSQYRRYLHERHSVARNLSVDPDNLRLSVPLRSMARVGEHAAAA
jgi:hypothetical protein